VHGQAPERALVDEPQLGTLVVEDDADPQVLLVRPARGGDEHLPAHPEVREHRVAVVVRARAVQLEPQVLPPPPGGGDRAAGQARREVGAALEVPAHRARVGHVDPGDRAVHDMVGQPPPDDLDLGQLGH